MDMITKILNLLAPTITFILLFVYLILFSLPKLLLSFVYSFFPDEDVTGKVVIITGASSGIGEELAYEYGRRGARVVLAAKMGKNMNEIAKKCVEIGSPDTLTVTADVTSITDCKRLIDSTISHFGTLDHLVCNAGILSISMFEDYEDITKVRPIMDVNFWGCVYLTRLAIPHLRKSRGKIIGMSSAASWLPVPRMSIYNASKAAIVALFKTLRIEVGSDIHTTLITPGFVDSEMTKGKRLSSDGRMVIDQKMRNVVLSIVPLCKTEECAKAVVKGACRGKKYVTIPTWYRVTYLWKALFPEVVDRVLKFMYIAKPGVKGSMSERFIDLLGLTEKLNPSSISSPDIKME